MGVKSRRVPELVLLRTDGLLHRFLKHRRFLVPSVRVLQNTTRTRSEIPACLAIVEHRPVVRHDAMFPDLLHEHVDVGLGWVQDVSVWVFQALHGDFHRLSVDVDPPRCAARQKCPVVTFANQILHLNASMRNFIAIRE